MTEATDLYEGPEHNARGFFVGGPQMVNPSDVLAKAMEEAKGTLAESKVAPTPQGQRRQDVVYGQRRALKRRYPEHGVREFLTLVFA